MARRARQVIREAPAGAVVAVWPSGAVTLQAAGFEAHELYGGDRAFPLLTWRVEAEARRPWAYELRRDIRAAAQTRRPFPGMA